jgi:hypothetical protein
MPTTKTIYSLSILRLTGPWTGLDSRDTATPINSYESFNPFVNYAVGDTFGEAFTFLGSIASIHHKVGEFEDKGELKTRVETWLYLDQDN